MRDVQTVDAPFLRNGRVAARDNGSGGLSAADADKTLAFPAPCDFGHASDLGQRAFAAELLQMHAQSGSFEVPLQRTGQTIEEEASMTTSTSRPNGARCWESREIAPAHWIYLPGPA